MGWKEILEKIKLVDINADPDQVGVINIKVENNIYVLRGVDPKDVTTLISTTKTPELERRVHQEAAQRLENLGASPKFISQATMEELAAVMTATSALLVISKDPDE